MGSSKYTQLKDLISLKVSTSEIHDQLLEKIKVMYQKDINSTRRFEQIRTIGQLLQFMEKRDLLSEDNILPLEVLAAQLSNQSDLIRCIEVYKTMSMLKQRSNRNNNEQSRDIMQHEDTAKTEKYNSFMDGLSDKKRERIIKTITEEIGSYWSNLARHLDIKESEIDQIQLECEKNFEKASKVMEIYYDKADRQKWFFDLISALENAQRRDLSDELRRIATMNI